MLTLALIAGIWANSCVQTQVSTHQGFARETYTIEKNGDFEYTREWFKDAKCSEPFDVESEAGSLTVGKKISSIFISSNVFEVDFYSQGGSDLGAMTLVDNKLKISRGMKNSTMRNTMLSMFEFMRQ